MRQHFTGYEEDLETGLNFAQARYQSPTQGRFTSVDPLMASASVARPQSWNRYTYCANNPLNYVDPTGQDWYRDTKEKGSKDDPIHPVWFDDKPKDSRYVAWDGPWTYQSSESNKWIVLSNSNSHLSYFDTQEAALASLAPPEHDWDPSCANCEALSHEMNRYTPALTQSMNIMGTYMFLFTGPTGEMGELTSLGLEATDEASTALSTYRLTQEGESFLRYESGNPDFSRVTADGGLEPGTFTAPAGEGVMPQGSLPQQYNLPDPQILRSTFHHVKPPSGTWVVGPRPVSGGIGSEVMFPYGSPPGSVTGPFGVPR